MNKRIRTCIACRKKAPKETFIRIIRTPKGEVKKTKNYNEEGRGAYLCQNSECIQKACDKKNALSHHLKVKVDPKIITL